MSWRSRRARSTLLDDQLERCSDSTLFLLRAHQEEFAIEIPDLEADKILSITEAVDYIASHPQAK